MAEKKAALFLVGFGGPERPEDVRPFIEDVVRGKDVPQARIDAVCRQYEQIGGSSPYNRLTALQAGLIEAAMRKRRGPAKIYLGYLFSQPSVAQAIDEMVNDGIEQAATIIMAPHAGSHQRYMATIRSVAQAACRKGQVPDMTPLPDWHTHPLYIQAVIARIQSELDALADNEAQRARIIFCAHSTPVTTSQQTGYAHQVEESAALAFAQLQGKYPEIDYVVGWQSRSGPSSQAWLEPDVCTCISQAKEHGKSHIVLVPIGFLVDHVEVLFDLDVLAANHACSLAVATRRAATVFDQPLFIEMLAGLAQQTLETSYARP